MAVKEASPKRIGKAEDRWREGEEREMMAAATTMQAGYRGLQGRRDVTQARLAARESAAATTPPTARSPASSTAVRGAAQGLLNELQDLHVTAMADLAIHRVSDIAEYLLGPDAHPVLLVGEAGCGKTCSLEIIADRVAGRRAVVPLLLTVAELVPDAAACSHEAGLAGLVGASIRSSMSIPPTDREELLRALDSGMLLLLLAGLHEAAEEAQRTMAAFLTDLGSELRPGMFRRVPIGARPTSVCTIQHYPGSGICNLGLRRTQVIRLWARDGWLSKQGHAM